MAAYEWEDSAFSATPKDPSPIKFKADPVYVFRN